MVRRLYCNILPCRFLLNLKDNKIVENIDWEGSRPKLLLKAIIFHGGKDIPKDVLIEDIWPESNAKAGGKNFKINLHGL